MATRLYIVIAVFLVVLLGVAALTKRPGENLVPENQKLAGESPFPPVFETIKISATDSVLPQGEPEIAADNNGRVAAVWMMGSPENIRQLTFRAAFSTDGGKTFAPDTAIAENLRLADPAIAADNRGGIYLGALRKDSIGWEDVAVTLFHSPDFGRSWKAPTAISDDGAFYDRDWITVDAKGNIHVVFTHRILRPGIAGGYERIVYYTVSVDGGKTFLPKIKISAGSGMGIAATPDATVYIATQAGEKGYLFRQQAGGQAFENPLEFTTKNIAIALTGGPRAGKDPAAHIETFPRLATYTDRNNKTTAYAAWVGQQKNGDHGIYLARLLPDGTSFETPRAIATGLPGQFRLPALTVDRKGNAHIFWIQKVSSANAWALFYARTNGERADKPAQISPFDFPIEQWPGDFISAAANDTDLFVSWAAAGGPQKGVYVSTAKGAISALDSPAASRVPDNKEMLGWIRDLVGFGYRRPGTEEGQKAERYIEEKFKEFGLEQVRLEPVPVEVWRREKWEFSVEDAGKQYVISSFPAPFSRFTSAEGIKADMAYVGEGTAKDYENAQAKGKIAVVDIRFPPLFTDESKARAYFTYDPNNTMPPGYTHPAVRSGGNSNLEDAYEQAVRAGAVGVVGILKDMPANKHTFYAPYPNPQETPEPLPMAYVGRDDGAALRRQLQTKPLAARLVNYGHIEPGVTHNVVGILPGKTDDAILISSHHDSPFAGAVQDGSGISTVLALAKYFSATPREEQSATLWFVATAGHFYGSVGLRTFARRHAHDLNPKLLAAIHLEQIAEEFIERDGELTDTGLPEPAFLFVSDDSLLPAVQEAVIRYDMERTFIMRADENTGVRPSGESSVYFSAGVPIIGLASLPVYLLFEDDTMDKVAADRLSPTAAAMAELVEKIGRDERADDQ